MNKEDKELLDRLENLKNEKPHQKVLLVFPGKPQVEISMNYHELHRTFADLMACKSKIQNGENLKDITLHPDDEYGHFCRDNAKGTFGLVLEPVCGVMLRFHTEEASELYRQILNDKSMLITPENISGSIAPDINESQSIQIDSLKMNRRYFKKGKFLGSINQ
ncbi:hypothetical protein [Citrobacter sp. TSA-1]|uniref:hypothetical protein n=1 Tax=Citrobacter sp. TSA-1 TaxID=184912 RepID=UPI0020B713BD|nr:hypothetical protein [Citrobacter sp. TSA-1]